MTSSPTSKGAVALAALLLCTPLHAADSTGVFAQEGPGRLSCERAFSKDETGEQARLVAAWVTGFVTAHNALLDDTFDLTPWQTPATLLSLLNQFCTANPDKSVTDGMLQLVEYLKPGRLENAAKLVVLGTEGKQTILYDAVVVQARERLALAGFPPGPTLEDLANAITAYQSDTGLEATGLLDQRTLARLLQ